MADIFLCLGRSCKLSKYFQLTNNWVVANPNQPPPPTAAHTSHLSCCCDWFCLMELERGNNFIELDFNIREPGTKARAALLFDFHSFFFFFCSSPCLLLSVEHNTIRWSLKGTRALKHVTEARFSAWSWTRFCFHLPYKLTQNISRFHVCFVCSPVAGMCCCGSAAWEMRFTTASVNICAQLDTMRSIFRLIFVQIHLLCCGLAPFGFESFHFRRVTIMLICY